MPTSPRTPGPSDPPILLAGGNPQIAKGDGEAPVAAYLAALPGWKGDHARRLDALVGTTVPEVQKAVRWNTPFYGVAGRGWFLGFHGLARSLKVSFLRGLTLTPPPPLASKHPAVRSALLLENEDFDEALWSGWIAQAAEQDGERLF